MTRIKSKEIYPFTAVAYRDGELLAFRGYGNTAEKAQADLETEIMTDYHNENPDVDFSEILDDFCEGFLEPYLRVEILPYHFGAFMPPKG